MHVSRLSGMALTLVVTAPGCARQSASPSPARIRTLSAVVHSSSLISRAQFPGAPRVSDPIALTVVYPALTDLVRVRDSSFLFGSVANDHVRLTINGSP